MRSLESTPAAAAAPPPPPPPAAAAALKKKKPNPQAAPTPGPQYDKSYGYSGRDCVSLLDYRLYGGAIDEACVRLMKNLLFAPTHPTYLAKEATMGHAPTADELDGVWSMLPFVMRDNTKFSRPVVAALFQPWENAMNETVSESRLVYMVYGTDPAAGQQLLMYNLDGEHSEALSANMIVYKPTKSEWCKEAFVDYQAKRVILELKKRLRKEDLADNSEFRIPSSDAAVAKVASAISTQNLRASLLVFAGCDSAELNMEERTECTPFALACNHEYVASKLTPLLGRLAFGAGAPLPVKLQPPKLPKADPKPAAAGKADTLVFVPSHKQGSQAEKKRPAGNATTPGKSRDAPAKKKQKRPDDELEYSDESLSSGSEEGSSSDEEESSEEDEDGSGDESGDDHSDDDSGDSDSDDVKSSAPAREHRKEKPVHKSAKAKPGPSKPRDSAEADLSTTHTQEDSATSSAAKPTKARTAKDRRQQIVDKGKRALAVLDQIGEIVPIAHTPQLTAKVAAVREAQHQYGVVGKVDEHTSLIMELTELVLHLGTILTTIGAQNDTAFPSARVSRAAALSLARVYLAEAPEMETMSAGLSEMMSKLAELQAARLRVVQETERMGAQLSLLPDSTQRSRDE